MADKERKQRSMVGQCWAINREGALPVVGAIIVRKQNDHLVIDDFLTKEPMVVRFDVFIEHGKRVTPQVAEGLVAIYNHHKTKPGIIEIMREAVNSATEYTTPTEVCQAAIDLTPAQMAVVRSIFDELYIEVMARVQEMSVDVQRRVDVAVNNVRALNEVYWDKVVQVFIKRKQEVSTKEAGE
ncbi:MAG: hypothetical protein PVI90_00400 [Desulfobacteraceae bacterium]